MPKPSNTRHHPLALSISVLLLSAALSSQASAQAFPASLNLGSLDGSNGFRLDGAAAEDRSGFSVSAAGDINGDGIDDLIVGAYAADSSGSDTGSSYVVFGRNTPFDATRALSSLDGSNGFRLNGAAEDVGSGFSVRAAGDINGDGIDDLIVGQRTATISSNAGRSHVVFGRTTPFPATITLSSLDGSNGFRLDGAAGDRTGRSVGAAGDINGDGIDDLIIGNHNDAGNGSYYVVFGRTTPFASTLSLSSLDGSTGFRLDGVAAGGFLSNHSVSAAGDVNGDGISDLIVSAYRLTTHGSSYIVFGRSTPFAARIELSSLDGSLGFRMDGAADGDRAGFSVSAAGDINGDGIDDLIVGAPYADPLGSASGSSYVVFGRTTPFDATVALSGLNGNNGFRLDGVAAGDFSGRSVSAAVDVNGDGIDDLVIGASGADPNGNNSGSSYVMFGRTLPFPAVVALGSLDGSIGFRLAGVAPGDNAGASVSAAGDINGDGFDDLIIGAFGASPNGSRSGSSYVVFGRDTQSVFRDGFE